MKRNPEARRLQIVNAAGGIFAMQGYAGARVDEIAAASGLNKRLLYHYVGDKTALFDAVLEQAVDQLPSLFDVAGVSSQPRRVRLWRLLLEEHAHGDQPVLLPALIATLRVRSAGSTSQLQALTSTAAIDMLDCLLPGLLSHLFGADARSAGVATVLAGAAEPAGDVAGKGGKPKVRMVPDVRQSGVDP